MLISPKKKTAFHTAILSWYEQHGRKSLPWRNYPRDGSCAYEIYVSEIMLQQTQVSRVLESYYYPFLRAFPTLSAIAKAEQNQLLSLWQGLGYYHRALRMQECAISCEQLYGGTLPRDFYALKSLSGIGDYTAGAIMCFGFGEVVSFADSNIARVLGRFCNAEGRQILVWAKELVCQTQCFDYHQALIDIGALICTKTPKCAICPLESMCYHAYKKPPLKKPTPRIKLTLHLAIITRPVKQASQAYHSQTHSETLQTSQEIALCLSRIALYKGLYNLPRLSVESNTPLQAYTLLGSFSHTYTKYAITAYVYMIDVSVLTSCSQTRLKTSCNKALLSENELLWYAMTHLPPISNLTKKALAYL